MFYFVRLNDAGMIVSALPYRFTTRAEAEAKAPVILLGKRTIKLALVQLLADVNVVATVTYDNKATRKC